MISVAGEKSVTKGCISSSHQSSNGWQRMCDFHQGHWWYKIKLLSLCLWMNTKVSVYPWNGALNNISGWGCRGGLCACSVSLLCLTLCDPVDCSLPGSSVHGISQARILEWVAIPFPMGSFRSRDRTWDSCIAGGFFTFWTTRESWGGGVRTGSSFLPYPSRRTWWKRKVKKNCSPQKASNGGSLSWDIWQISFSYRCCWT